MYVRERENINLVMMRKDFVDGTINKMF